MKQFRRLSAMLLALGTVCSLMAPAGAASAAAADPMNLLSDHAGTTRTVQVVTCDFEGNTNGEYVVNVSVPEDATKAEEMALVQASAVNAAGLPTSRAPYLGDLICQRSNVTLSGAGSAITVGKGQLQRDYNTLIAMFDGVGNRGANRINVRVANNNYYTNSYSSSTLRENTYTTVYLFTNKLDPNQGGTPFRMKRLDILTVYASTDIGGADVRNIYVSATNY